MTREDVLMVLRGCIKMTRLDEKAKTLLLDGLEEIKEDLEAYDRLLEDAN